MLRISAASAAVFATALAGSLGVASPALAASSWWPLSGASGTPPEAAKPAQPAPLPGTAAATPSAEAPPEDLGARMRVADIAVRGNKTVTTEQVLLALPIHRGDEVTKKQVQDALQRLYGLGYFADVRAFTEPTPAGERLVFQVVENPRLEDVRITGITVFKQDEVLKPFVAIKGQTLNLREVQKHIKDLEKRYADEGYVLARVIDLQVDPKSGVLDLKVAEGEIEAIRIIGNEETRDYVIRRELTQKPGELFNFKKMEDDLRRVYNLNYFEDIGIKYEPGKTLDKVVVVINVKEKQTGMFQMSAGYSNRDGVLGILSLRKDNLFGRGQSISTDLTLSMAGNNSGEVSYFNPWIDEAHTSLGVSLYSRRYLNFLNQRVLSTNLIGTDSERQKFEQDKGTSLMKFAEGRSGSQDPVALLPSQNSIETRTGMVLSMGRPLVGDAVTSPVRATLSLKGEQIGVKRLVPTLGLEGSSAQDTVSYATDLAGKAPPLVLGANPASGTDNAFSTGLTLTYDTRDLVINPSRGWLSSLALEQYLGPVVGNLDLTRLNVEANRYFLVNYPFWDLKHTFAVGTKFGSTMSFFNRTVPTYERFYSTGPYLIRGWEETLPSSLDAATRDYASLFQGDSVAIASIEYRFPIVSVLSGVVFADTGLFWDQLAAPSARNSFHLFGDLANPLTGQPLDSSGIGSRLRSGYGVGVRVNTPLGPLRLDLGVSQLRDDQGNWFPKGIKPHFSIGQKF
ncbi:MAG: BamA/TamA family outer membrane protein [Candidatus Sericytochromatia bacterium]|nr:BamA/TamA family outer membrane protein [Candidatus Tanganyikabacteria bacterium]